MNRPRPTKRSRAWADDSTDGPSRRLIYFNRTIHVDIRKLGSGKWSWRVYDDFEGFYGCGYKPSKKQARIAAGQAKEKVKFPKNK